MSEKEGKQSKAIGQSQRFALNCEFSLFHKSGNAETRLEAEQGSQTKGFNLKEFVFFSFFRTKSNVKKHEVCQAKGFKRVMGREVMGARVSHLSYTRGRDTSTSASGRALSRSCWPLWVFVCVSCSLPGRKRRSRLTLSQHSPDPMQREKGNRNIRESLVRVAVDLFVSRDTNAVSLGRNKTHEKNSSLV